MKKRFALIFLYLLLICLLTASCTAPEAAAPYAFSLTAFSIGKADAILLQFDGHSVLIDAGEHGDGERLVRELADRGVEKLDLLLLTHYDKDHIGGADAVLQSIAVENVRMPAYEVDTKQYRQLGEALSESGAKVIRMDRDESFSIGRADCSVWASTVAYDGKNDNEQSLIAKVLYGGRTYLFAGDAEGALLKDLVYSTRNLTCDVMKLPHHGVYDKNLITFLTVSMPETVLITDSEKNPADTRTLELLDTFGCTTYRTANGTISLLAEDGSVSVDQ